MSAPITRGRRQAAEGIGLSSRHPRVRIPSSAPAFAGGFGPAGQRLSSSGEDRGPSSLGRGFESRWTHQLSDGWPSGLGHRGASAEDASVPQVRILLHPPCFVAHSSVAERPAYTRPAAVRFRLRRPDMERWSSGLRRRSRKPEGLRVPWVRIPPSPPVLKPDRGGSRASRRQREWRAPANGTTALLPTRRC